MFTLCSFDVDSSSCLLVFCFSSSFLSSAWVLPVALHSVLLYITLSSFLYVKSSIFFLVLCQWFFLTTISLSFIASHVSI